MDAVLGSDQGGSELSAPSYQEVVDLWKEAWSEDYGIVGHSGEPIVSFFAPPREHGQYTVTGLEFQQGVNEEDFLRKLTEKPLVVFIQCMDRRGNAKAYQRVEKMIQERDDLSDANIFHLSVGGGIIQRETVTQEGEEVEVKRAKAMRRLLQYVAEHADVQWVVSTDHDCRCGAEAFAHDGEGWPEQLDCEPGDQAEQGKMMQLIKEHTQELLPKSWQNQGIVDQYLVHFVPGAGDDQWRDVELKPIKA